VSLLVPDDVVPDPVTGVGSGFVADTSDSAFSAIDLDWSSYNELKQRDVVRYRIYDGPSFFTNVAGMHVREYVPAGTFRHTIQGLFGGSIILLPWWRRTRWGTGIRRCDRSPSRPRPPALGEVQNLMVVSSRDSLRFTWTPPEQFDAFLSRYRVYFGDSTNPISVSPDVIRVRGDRSTARDRISLPVSTVDTFNTESAGLAVLAATWLAHPANLAVQSFDGMARLTWTHAEPNDLVKHYAVYRSSTPFSSVSG
jgi:hypothetical protein